MDRAIRIATTAVAIAVVAVHGARGQSDSGKTGARQRAGEMPGTLIVPGTSLDSATTYALDLLIGSRRVRGSFRPTSAQSPVAGDTGQTKSGNKKTDAVGTTRSDSTTGAPPTPGVTSLTLIVWVLVAAAAAALVCGFALWYYFRRHVPKRELAPYDRALQAVREGRYADALRDLTSVEAKLPDALRTDARFFIGVCHFHLNEVSEAERVMAARHRESPGDQTVAYFLAYIRTSRGYDAEAEPVLETMRKGGHLQYRDTAYLMSIVKFRRAMAAYQSGQLDAAAELFADVANLGHFAANIPTDLRNRHVMLGTRALFDKDIPTAREHFDALSKIADQTAGDAGDALRARARLGQALALWIEDDPTQMKTLAKMLIETCRLFHPAGPTELPWPTAEPGTAKGSAEALKQALAAADQNFDMRPEQKDVLRCLRDVHLLRAVAVLKEWSLMDGKAAHAAIEPRLKDVFSILACARAIDERFSDVYLITGLLLFYLHPPGPERATGVDLLLEARKLGMRDPDAMEIVNNRERIERENASAVDRYQQVLDRYLRDDTVRKEVRLDLLSRLATHRTFMNRYKPPDMTRARTVPPTVDELKLRSETLHNRIGEIGRTAPSPELKQLGHELKQHSDALSQQAAAIEKTEAELLALTGAELFKDK